jgi:hypothetical protein
MHIVYRMTIGTSTADKYIGGSPHCPVALIQLLGLNFGEAASLILLAAPSWTRIISANLHFFLTIQL